MTDVTADSIADGDAHAAPARNEIRDALSGLKSHYGSAALFSGAINLLYLASPLYLMQVYNRVLVNESVGTLVMLTIILTVALMAMAALDAARARVLVRCGVRLDNALSGRVFEALVRRAAQRGASVGGQRLRQLDDFRTFVTGPGVHFLFDLPWIPVYLLLLFFIHPVLGAVATLGAVVLLLLALANEAFTRKPLQEAEASGARAYAFTDNLLRHADVVRAMGMQAAVERHWQTNRASMLARQAYASDRHAAMSATIRFFRLLLQSLMLGVGAWLAIDHAIQPATIFAASIVMGRALVPVEQAVATWKQFVTAREGYQALKDMLERTPAARPRMSVPRDESAVGARDLVYTLPGRQEPTIRGLSFDFGAGQIIGVIGPSGSGKSTLARLLVGALTPTRGRLRFGGVDYAHWNAAEFGRMVGYLPQDVGLFAGTVRENIARFGEATDEEIVAAARRAGIHEMILDLPQQYDTRLGAGGVGLSGGQRQRLGLARAVLGSPALLVLDEPNSNLDAAGEGALKDAIRELAEQGSTIVVVTHRTTILDVVDMVMVVRAGELDLVGRPQDVFAQLRERRAATQNGERKPDGEAA